MPSAALKSGVIILLPRLSPGGAERVCVNLANHLSATVPVILAVIRPCGELSCAVSRGVRVVDLGGRIWWWLRLVQLVWRARPRAVLSTLWDVNLVLLSLRGIFPRATRVVVREASTPEGLMRSWRHPRLTLALYRALYRRADYVVALTEQMRDAMETCFHVPRAKIVVVANGTDIHEKRCDGPSADGAQPYVLGAGRLHSEKRFDLLISAFSHLPEALWEYKLVVAGDGPERHRLLGLVASLGLQRRVFLVGYTKNMASLMREASLFVLPSRYEGSPNAAIEALCMGTPVLASAGNTGAEELVEEGVNGFLVADGDERSLATSLAEVIGRLPELDRERIAAAARHKHSLRAMVERYRAVLLGVEM